MLFIWLMDFLYIILSMNKKLNLRWVAALSAWGFHGRLSALEVDIEIIAVFAVDEQKALKNMLSLSGLRH